MGKDCNLEYEYLERRKRGHQKLGLESDLISKTVISNLISKKLTSKKCLGAWLKVPHYRFLAIKEWVLNETKVRKRPTLLVFNQKWVILNLVRKTHKTGF